MTNKQTRAVQVEYSARNKSGGCRRWKWFAVINNHCQLGAGECRVAIFPRTGSAGPVVPDVSNDSLNMELRYQIVYVLK